jgi:hypothetical protein
MKWGAAVAISLAVVAAPSYAQNQETALQMQSWCQPFATISVDDRGAFIWPSGTDSRVCWGAFAAIQELSQIYEDGKPILPGICARPSTTRIQYIRIFLRYVGEHPELADAEFAWVAGKALSEAFPCP